MTPYKDVRRHTRTNCTMYLWQPGVGAETKVLQPSHFLHQSPSFLTPSPPHPLTRSSPHLYAESDILHAIFSGEVEGGRGGGEGRGVVGVLDLSSDGEGV